MDISVAASMFDDQPIYDKYTGDLLFTGQPQNYDGSVRDSVASWRQAVSTAKVVWPARGVITFGDETFIAGRTIQDFFQGDVVRENLVIHPCDGLYEKGPASDFLTEPPPVDIESFYGGVAWRKTSSDEKESPEFHNICDVYFSTAETYPKRDSLILSDIGMLYRVRSIEIREGGFIAAVCSELGTDVIVDISYTTKGAYDAATDSMLSNAPIDIKAILELTKTNFKFVVADSEKYKPGDRVITVRVADVASPEPEDSIAVGTRTYRVISANRDDDGGCWELHVRRV